MTTAELDPLQEDQLRKMGLPSRLGITVSKDNLGFQWEAPPHILLMERKILAKIFDTSTQSFISISMPPRHGKSFYCSVFLAAWFLGMFPNKRVILVTYSDDFAKEWGRLVRNLLTRIGQELFGVTVDSSADSATNWKLSNSIGGMLAAGIESGITGKGADLIIIDDLIKNQEEARSAARKQAHHDEYVSSVRSRLEPGGTIVYVGTRWAPDDLPGRLRETVEDGDEWEFVDFPALAELPKDYEGDWSEWEDELGRHVHEVVRHDAEGNEYLDYEGDALWAGRWDVKTLRQIRNTLLASGQALTWHALYQGIPRLAEDATFDPDKWGSYPAAAAESLKTECIKLVRSWDLASSKGKGDWTVGTLMGLHRSGRVYIFDVIRGRLAPADVETRVLETAQEDGVQVKILIEEERSGSGKTVSDGYKRRLIAHDVEGIRAVGDKEERAFLYSAKQGHGLIMLPDSAHWRQAWIDEHRDFGYTRHDDQVDTGSQGFNELAKLGEGISIFAPPRVNPRAEEILRELMVTAS